MLQEVVKFLSFSLTSVLKLRFAKTCFCRKFTFNSHLFRTQEISGSSLLQVIALGVPNLEQISIQIVRD